MTLQLEISVLVSILDPAIQGKNQQEREAFAKKAAEKASEMASAWFKDHPIKITAKASLN